MKKAFLILQAACLRSIFIITFFFFGLTNLKAQTKLVKQWDKSFGGNEYDHLHALQQTSDGGYILGGASYSGMNGDKSQNSKGGADYWIVKLDSNGNKLWDKTYGGSQYDELRHLKQTADGGYILGGWSRSEIGGDKSQSWRGDYDYWVVKLDSNGVKLWDKTFGGTGIDEINSIVQTADGGYILGGHSQSGISGDKTQASKGSMDFWLIKVDANGNKLWEKTLGGNTSDNIATIQATSDGGFIVGGWSGSTISGDKTEICRGAPDYWIIKLDAAGNKTWDKTFGGNDYDLLRSLQQTSDGGYILGGYSESGISGDKSQPNQGPYRTNDFWVLKLDANGTKVWDKTFGGSSHDDLKSVWQAPDGGYMLCGNSFSSLNGDKTKPSKGDSDFWVLKLDANGNKLWDEVIGGSGTEYLTSSQLTFDGGFILGGWSFSPISGDKSEAIKGDADYWIIKFPAQCSVSTASLSALCNNNIVSVKLNVNQNQNPVNPSWTLTYKIDGKIFTATSNADSLILTQHALPGSIYSLVSIGSNGCTVNLNNTLTVPLIPVAPAVTAGSKLCAGSITLSAVGAPTGGSYVWYDVATGGIPLHNSPTGTFTTPHMQTTATYYVAATTDAGCEGPRTPVIATIGACSPTYIPNLITLNQDGKNDTFQPQNLPEGKWQLQIFNRWGIKIFGSENYQNNWPEKKIADGTYYYLLKNAETSQQYKGWVGVVQ